MINRSFPGFLDETRQDAVTNRQTESDLKPPDPTVVDRPRLLEPQPDAPTSIGDDWRPQTLHQAPPSMRAIVIVALGFGILIGCWAMVSIITSIGTAYSISVAFGRFIGIGYSLALLVFLFAGWSEWRAFRLLQEVNRLRDTLDLAVADPKALKARWQLWLAGIKDRVDGIEAAMNALGAAETTENIRIVLRNQIGHLLDKKARDTGLRLATEGSLLVAISPHASWDGLVVGLYGMRIIRRIAAEFGLRPSWLVTAVLLRRTWLIAADVAAIDYLTQTMTQSFLERAPIVKHLASAIPGAGATEFRLYRLAVAAGQACNPLSAQRNP